MQANWLKSVQKLSSTPAMSVNTYFLFHKQQSLILVVQSPFHTDIFTSLLYGTFEGDDKACSLGERLHTTNELWIDETVL